MFSVQLFAADYRYDPHDRLGTVTYANNTKITYTFDDAGNTKTVTHELDVPTEDSDSDSDGLPDQFESDHGLNPFDPKDADLDLDKDGMSNYGEYLSGTNPSDPKSVFRIEEVAAAKEEGQPFRFTLKWKSIEGKAYRIEKSYDLNTWTFVKTEVAMTPNNTTQFEDANRRVFYRILPRNATIFDGNPP